MHKHIHIFIASLLFTLPLPTPAATPQPPATTTAATQPVDPRWTTLLQQLAADDFAQREAAQKQLDQSTWRDLDLLQKLADSAADPEVKARLSARIATLNEDLAVNPPPLTVSLKDASLTEVADLFSKTLGTKLDIWPPSRIRNQPNDLFTLAANDMPFWEVFLALSRQHPFSLQDMGSSLRLMSQGGGNGWRTGIVTGPVAIFPQSITRSRTASLQFDKGAELSPETMSLNCTLAIDPRIQIVRYTNPVFSEILDDAGNTLFKQTAAADNFWEPSNRNVALQSFSVQLQIPEKRGTRITSAKGSIRYVAQCGEEHVDIADPEKKSGQNFDLVGSTIRLSRFTAQGNADNININLGLEITRAPQPAAAPNIDRNGLNTSNPTYPTATLFDSTGKILYSQLLRGSMSASIGGNNFTAPFKLRLSLPTKTKEITLPFELKDLPLP